MATLVWDALDFKLKAAEVDQQTERIISGSEVGPGLNKVLGREG